MDEQAQMDAETKARRYDRIVLCQQRLAAAQERVRLLAAQLRVAKNDVREAGWDLVVAMTPVPKGVRG